MDEPEGETSYTPSESLQIGLDRIGNWTIGIFIVLIVFLIFFLIMFWYISSEFTAINTAVQSTVQDVNSTLKEVNSQVQKINVDDINDLTTTTAQVIETVGQDLTNVLTGSSQLVCDAYAKFLPSCQPPSYCRSTPPCQPSNKTPAPACNSSYKNNITYTPKSCPMNSSKGCQMNNTRSGCQMNNTRSGRMANY